MPATDKSAQLFEQYLSQRKVLVADSVGASRARLGQTLVNLGAKTSNLLLTGSYDEAVSIIEKQKPHVILCDYDFGKQSGLNLLQSQRAQFGNTKETLFILVTGNTSQSAVAQAAEEDVDTFVIKPYTVEVLRQSIMRTAIAKLHPSDYMKKIEAGKDLLEKGGFDDAFKTFEEAAALDSKPSLALFYAGHTKAIKKEIPQAEERYKSGLSVNKIHYKCLVGLYESQMERKEHAEAYDTIKKLSRYFPANPKRMTEVLRLAIITKSYEDVERYYQLFTEIDQRNDELIKYVCAALVVCGKYYLGAGFKSRAIELFQKAAVTGSGRTRILREIISALAVYGLHKEAHAYLSRFPADTRGGADYLTMEYLVMDPDSSTPLSIERGRDLLKKQIEEPMVYKILIRRSFEHGLKDYAEELLEKALKKWPDLSIELKQIQIEAEAVAAEKQAAAPPTTGNP